jgi:hypothetical protein
MDGEREKSKGVEKGKIVVLCGRNENENQGTDQAGENE